MGFAIVLTIVIFVAATVRFFLTSDRTADTDGTRPVVWSDTLTNSLSDRPELVPMDRAIERFMSRYAIRGLSIAVTRDDSLLFTKGYGMADAEAGIHMSPDYIMRIASASKLVTAIAVMKLCEQGRLSLDSKVFGEEGILCDTAFTNAMCDRRMRDITVDHLLLHQGGFGRGAGDPMFNTPDIIRANRLAAPPSADDLIRIVLRRRIAFAPGQGRSYSNFGYMVLSRVIERVTGMSYWDYVEREILHPAGIYGFSPATNYYAERAPREVRYYGPDDEPVEEWNGSGRLVERVYGGNNVRGLMGAGGWCASSADLARLVASVDGNPRLPDILSIESVQLLTDYGDDGNMARGWSRIDSNGRKWTRTGTHSSAHSLVQRFPDDECWVILTNTGVWTGHHFSADLTALVSRLRSSYSSRLPRQNLWQ